MIDYIYSKKSGDRYAEIDYALTDPEKYRCDGFIISHKFPDIILQLMHDYNEIVNQGAISLIDDVEEKIYNYDLRLCKSNNRIFNICICEDKKIFFYLRYPTSNGFRDKY